MSESRMNPLNQSLWRLQMEVIATLRCTLKSHGVFDGQEVVYMFPLS
jgi:hypothetical protein